MAGTKGRSARGLIVDFDILRIREKLSRAPKPVTVKERENYIESKARRRRKKPGKEEEKKDLIESEEEEEGENNEDKAEE
jgi:hypothetical protein